MTTENNKNPLMCDPETGMCQMPGAAADNDADIDPVSKPVKIIYYTDPICSSCWGIEPQLRKLKLEYGDDFEIEYRMGGLLPDWSYNSGGISKPADVAHHWDEVSLYYEMPIDGDVWLEDPLDSSYPACIAVKAVQMQDTEKAVAFMRILREKLFLDKTNITRWKPIALAAIEAGLNTEQLKSDFDGPAKELFEQDLAYGRKLGVRGFPTLYFSDGQTIKTTVYGSKPYYQFEQALLSTYPEAHKTAFNNPSPIALFNKFPSLTAKEYAVILDIATNQAVALLEKTCSDGLLVKQSIKTGTIYRKK
jgi:putative protein-disulfide isomerase